MGRWRGLVRAGSDLVTNVLARRYETTRSVLARRYAAKLRTFLSLPGVSGNYASTPDNNVLDITGDIDIRVLAAANWTTTANCMLVGKWTEAGNLRAYRFFINNNAQLSLGTSTNGTVDRQSNSTIDVPLARDELAWVRATLDVNDGGGNRVTTFYTSPADDGANWTQFGDPVTVAVVTTIGNSTAPLEIGSRDGGTLGLHQCKIYRVIVLSGIGGTVVFDADFSNLPVGTTTFSESENDLVVTINASGDRAAAIQEEGI